MGRKSKTTFYTTGYESTEPQEPEDRDIRTEALAIIQARGVTFNVFKGKRCIHTDNALTHDEYRTLAEAMRSGLL